MLHLDLRDITLVLHDWGGPVGLGFAIRHPARLKRLVLINTWAFALWPGGPFPRLLEIIRSERGDKFVLERHGYLEPACRARPITSSTSPPRSWRPTGPLPTPASRLALLCWSRDIPTHVSDPSYMVMKQIETAWRSLPGRPSCCSGACVTPCWAHLYCTGGKTCSRRRRHIWSRMPATLCQKTPLSVSWCGLKPFGSPPMKGV